MLVKPLPYPESEDLVSIWHTAPGVVGYGDLPLSSRMFFTYGEENSVFEAFGLWRNGTASITGLGDPEQVERLAVTHGVLQAVGVQPATGRWFAQMRVLATSGRFERLTTKTPGFTGGYLLVY